MLLEKICKLSMYFNKKRLIVSPPSWKGRSRASNIDGDGEDQMSWDWLTDHSVLCRIGNLSIKSSRQHIYVLLDGCKYKIYNRQVVVYCKFCIYTHPVNSEFTIWHQSLLLGCEALAFRSDHVIFISKSIVIIYFTKQGYKCFERIKSNVKPQLNGFCKWQYYFGEEKCFQFFYLTSPITDKTGWWFQKPSREQQI